eukprot:CAMPEP_0114325952 /NCGR_PEP_ID=MMETSP0059-20121206/29427_1 /TAXON_ID=36894 /ORGANISM="Pyramimonas parkeae, Strain CCMP726" /LENGTH=460 /DNA_ID=CAMNT_0001454817 /DNA_START=159 /DNA_END=1541 /DNA_ORIENTATION=+
MPWVAQGITRDVLFVGDILQALADTNVDTIRIMTHLVLKDSLAPLEGMLVNRNMKIVCSMPGDQRCRIDAQASEEWVAHTGTEAQAAAAGTAGFTGAAIYAGSSSCVTCNKCTFTSHQASSGGAVGVHTALFTCNDCLFTGNTAKEGGALYLRGEKNDLSRAFLRDSVFHSNTATEDPGDAGGATYIGYYAHGVFTDTNFTRNRAEAMFYSQTVKGGGAMYFEFGGGATLVNTYFEANFASEFGRGPNILVDGNEDPKDTTLTIYPWPLPEFDSDGKPMILSTGTTSRLPTLEEYKDAVPVATTPCIYPPPLSPGSTSWPNAPGISSYPPPSPRSFDFEGKESEADATSTSNSDDELLVIVIVALVGLLILIAGCCVFVKCTEAGRYSCLGRLVNDEVDMEGTYAGQIRKSFVRAISWTEDDKQDRARRHWSGNSDSGRSRSEKIENKFLPLSSPPGGLT